MASTLRAAGDTGAGAAVPGRKDTLPFLGLRAQIAVGGASERVDTGLGVADDKAESDPPFPNNEESPLEFEELEVGVSGADSSRALLSPPMRWSPQCCCTPVEQ